jgi:hypothetical protein
MHAMSLTLLDELSRLKLPVTFADRSTVDQLRLLRAADTIICTLVNPPDATPFAKVLAITKEGRALLALEDLKRRRRLEGRVAKRGEASS